MKKVLSLLLIASLVAVSCSKPLRGSDNIIVQQRHDAAPDDNPHGGVGNNVVTVPAAVLSAFNSRYTNATNTEWKKLSDGTFKAQFLRGTVKWQATFTAAGVLVKEEHN